MIYPEYITSFNAVIPVITAFYFGLIGIGYIRKYYTEKSEKIEKRYPNFFKLMRQNNFLLTSDVEGNRNYLKSIKYYCLSSITKEIVPKRLSEIFLKAGMFAILVMIFGGIKHVGGNQVSFTRLIPVFLFVFWDFTRLSLRILFYKIKDEDIALGLLENKNVSQITSPFKMIANPKWYHFILSYFTPKYINSEYGRDLKVRLLVFGVMLILLIHICYFVDDTSVYLVVEKEFFYQRIIAICTLFVIIYPYLLMLLFDIIYSFRYKLLMRGGQVVTDAIILINRQQRNNEEKRAEGLVKGI